MLRTRSGADAPLTTPEPPGRGCRDCSPDGRPFLRCSAGLNFRRRLPLPSLGRSRPSLRGELARRRNAAPERPALPAPGLWAAIAAGRLLSAAPERLQRSSRPRCPQARRTPSASPPSSRSEGAGPRAAGAASLPPAEGRPGAWLPADDGPALRFRRPGGRGGLRRLGRAESCAASNTSFPQTGR